MTRVAVPALIAGLGAALSLAPVAQAQSFVECQLSVAKPFLYTVEGTDYMGSRVDVSACRTDQPSTPVIFHMHLTASGAPLEMAGPAHTLSYFETRYVHDGDSFSLMFPNNEQLMPLYPGVYGAKVTMRRALADNPGEVVEPGSTQDHDPRFFDYQCSTWEFPGMNCAPATHS